MDQPLVSIAIATHNMADYLPLAVQSALAQTYKPIEVIVVDDGSTDSTAEVIAPFLADSRVRYRMQTHGGVAVAKNRCVRESSGKYVAFLDADDLWAPEKLEVQMPLFAASPAVGIVYSAFVCIDEKGNRLRDVSGKLHRGRISGPLLISNFVGFGTSVVKRECFERLGLFKESLRMGVDYDLWLRFSTQYEFDYVDRPLLYYRKWPGQLSRNWQGRYLNGIEIMEQFLRDFPDAVDKRTVDEAWAHTYTGYGFSMRDKVGRSEALKLYLRALRHRPSYFPAWKGIVATILGR